MEIPPENPVEKEEDKEEDKTNIEQEMDQWINSLLETNSEEVEVIIEIPKDSRVKYEYDKDSQRMVCDRVLTTPFSYFFNYGYLTHTLSEDGDPMDAVVLMEDALFPGCSIQCRILGVLETEDERGMVPKLILCPTSKIDPTYEHWNDIIDVSLPILNKINYFFSHYKDLEKGTFVRVRHLLGKKDARQMVIESRMRYYTQLIDEGKLLFKQKSEKSIGKI